MIDFLKKLWNNITDFFTNVWQSFLDHFIDPAWHQFATTVLIIIAVLIVFWIIWSIIRKRM